MNIHGNCVQSPLSAVNIPGHYFLNLVNFHKSITSLPTKDLAPFSIQTPQKPSFNDK